MSGFPNNQSNPAGAIPVWIATQPAPVAPTTPFPATIAAGDTYDSGIIPTAGYRSLAVCANLDQAGVIQVTRYADAAGNSPIDVTQNQFGAPGAQSVTLNDGVPFLAVRVQITNSSGSLANLTHAVVLGG